MQDEGPSYSARQTIENPHTVGIVSVEWPPFLSRLYPSPEGLEKYEEFLEYRIPELNHRKRLLNASVCELLKFSSDSIGPEELWNLKESMPYRYQ